SSPSRYPPSQHSAFYSYSPAEATTSSPNPDQQHHSRPLPRCLSRPSQPLKRRSAAASPQTASSSPPPLSLSFPATRPATISPGLAHTATPCAALSTSSPR